jgi:hypothetical protein
VTKNDVDEIVTVTEMDPKQDSNKVVDGGQVEVLATG